MTRLEGANRTTRKQSAPHKMTTVVFLLARCLSGGAGSVGRLRERQCQCSNPSNQAVHLRRATGFVSEGLRSEATNTCDSFGGTPKRSRWVEVRSPGKRRKGHPDG